MQFHLTKIQTHDEIMLDTLWRNTKNEVQEKDELIVVEEKETEQKMDQETQEIIKSL